MKKLISLILVTAICLSMSVSAFALDKNEEIFASSRVSDVKIITQDSFQDFAATCAASVSECYFVTNNEAEYSYTMCKDALNEDAANVTLNFRAYVNNILVEAKASGIVDKYTLSSGDILWEGPIRGITNISGVEYKVIVGFAKLDNSEDVQVSVTIQSLDNDTIIDPIVFSFGKNLITNEMYQELFGDTTCDTDAVNFANELSTMASGSYTLKGTTSTSYKSGGFGTVPGTAQTSRIYYDSNDKRLALTVQSYCSNVNTYYSKSGIAGTTIKSLGYKLVRSASTTNSYIVGTESFDFDTSDFGSSAVLQPLFEDILSLLGVPTSTILTVFGSLKGTVTQQHNTNNTSVSVSFGITDNADFDKLSTGLPIVFQLGRSSAGTSQYTCTTDITYRTGLLPTGSQYTTTIYTDGLSASKTVSLTF